MGGESKENILYHEKEGRKKRKKREEREGEIVLNHIDPRSLKQRLTEKEHHDRMMTQNYQRQVMTSHEILNPRQG
jgi:hypothetical protein